MGFIFDGLDAEAYDRRYSDRALVARVIGYFRPQLGRMLVVAVAVVLQAILDVSLPILISRTIDQLAAGQATNLARNAILIAAIGSLAWVFNFVRRSFSARAVAAVVLKLREDAFDAVLNRDMSFYDQFVSGKIVSRVNSDTQAFAQVVTLTMDLFSQVLLVVLLMGYLFSINTTLTWITLALTPFIVFAALTFRRIARNTITQSRRITAEVSAHIQETVSGIGVAKTFRQENAIYDEFLAVNEQSFRINRRTGYVFSAIFPILNVLSGIGTALLVYVGGLNVVNGTLTPGEWYLFIQGLALFWFPVTSIASFWSQFQIGLAAAERIFALLDAEPRVVQTDNRSLPMVRGEIQFDRVDFAYKPGEPILKNFSLTIHAGETLALVGHTGSGKSSLARLIARFYEYQGGHLLIDGQDIRTLDLADYRTRLGLVTQTPFLFEGTVRENIRYGRPDATDEQVERAARQVGGGDWLAGLAQGLATEVGERGSSL
ncbi:MAG TPA: ABC transporter ATP-binding protein, partial [Anaerolineae bacterium]|nr:ABC transporter ATP-binding protein [Anaerolineae bacterium]